MTLDEQILDIAEALYDFDRANVEGRGDTLPPDEWNARDFKRPPFSEVHPLVRELYHGRAIAAWTAVERKLGAAAA